MSLKKNIFLLFTILFCSQTSLAQDDDFVFYSDLARDWYEAGQYFEWTSTTVDNNAAKVNVFYRTWGDASKPKLLLIPRLPKFQLRLLQADSVSRERLLYCHAGFPGIGILRQTLRWV
jgi:hypothetical protein